MRNAFEDITFNRLKQLIELNSEVLTEGERHFNDALHKELIQWPYFMQHSNHVGLHAIPEDELSREVLWAFVDKGAKNTIVLFGHCDVVTTNNFHELRDLAFSPERLKKALVDRGTECDDLSSDDWYFGRGSCDMKAGLAIQLVLLKEVSQSPEAYANILWLSVPDEENLSSGMRASIALIDHLKHHFKLEIPLAILSEPYDREEEDAIVTYSGTAGKIMPLIIARGIQTHAGDVYSGFNAISIMNEIVKAIDLNTEMSDVKYREMTSPPSFLGLRDLKEAYDVTTPEYVAGFFNWNFLNNNFEEKFDQLKSLCIWSLEDAINQLNYSYNEYLRKQHLPSYQCCKDFELKVLLLEELYGLLPKDFDYKGHAMKVYEEGRFVDDYAFTAEYVKQLMEIAKIKGPSVVLAMLPPIYPAVDSTAFYEEYLRAVVEETIDGFGAKHQLKHFFQKISDLSYCYAEDDHYETLIKNCPGLGVSYKLDFKMLTQMHMNVVNIGPWGKDLHLKTERVYLPDVTKHIPIIIENILKAFAD